MNPPATIHYYHGTRTSAPASFVAHGLRPLSVVLDALWEELAALMEEIAATELNRLRWDLTAGELQPHTYPLRVGGGMHHGPCGDLMRDALVHPREYHSVDYLAGSEIAVDTARPFARASGSTPPRDTAKPRVRRSSSSRCRLSMSTTLLLPRSGTSRWRCAVNAHGSTDRRT
jgi:hypothetical protein